MQRIDHRHGVGIGHQLELADRLHTVDEQLIETSIQAAGIGQRHGDYHDQHEQRQYR